MSDSLQPHVLEHARLLCIPLTPRVAEIHVHWDTLPFPSPFAFNLSQHQRFFPVSWLLALGGQSIELRQKCFQWIFRLVYFRIDCFDLLAVQGTLKSLLQHYNSKHWFFGTQPPLWSNSHLYMTAGKTIALTLWTFVGKVMSLLLNMMSRFVIAFLPRGKSFLNLWV